MHEFFRLITVPVVVLPSRAVRPKIPPGGSSYERGRRILDEAKLTQRRATKNRSKNRSV